MTSRRPLNIAYVATQNKLKLNNVASEDGFSIGHWSLVSGAIGHRVKAIY